MAVAMHQNDGLAERRRFLAHGIAKLGKTIRFLLRIARKRRKCGKDIGLLYDRNGEAAAAGGMSEART